MTHSSLRNFLANLRHDLRTPINAILGYSEMLIEDAAERRSARKTEGEDAAQDAADELAAELTADLELIHAAGVNLLTEVNEALEPAKIETGQLDGALEELETSLRQKLSGAVHAILGYSELLAEDAPAAGLRDWVADLLRIREAARSFQALISNIAAGYHINGREEDPDQPASPALSARSMPAHAPGETSHPPIGVYGALLVVDDNEINRDVLSRRLERQGHTVSVAENGRAALNMLSANTFDLVLLDVMMPELNGYQVLQWMKNQPALRDIPVIMISALDEIESVVRCIELGAEDYLPKPFNPVLLRARIGVCLEKKRLRDKEIEYLTEVGQVTHAAAAVEKGQFQPESLTMVSRRSDELGQLARVFQRMASEVVAREQRLRQQVSDLRIQIDEAKKTREVAEITESEYFQQLQQKAKRLRAR